MRIPRLMHPRSLLLVTLASCDDPDPYVCETTTPKLDEAEIRAELDTDADGGVFSVRLLYRGGDGERHGYVRPGEGQALTLLEGDQITHPHTPLEPRTFPLSETGADPCDPGPFTATLEPGLDALTVEVTNAGLSRRMQVRAAPIEVVSAPTRVTIGAPVELTLSRDTPAISGYWVNEGWYVELRGPCLVPDAWGFDVDGDGSRHAVSEDRKLRIAVQAEDVSDAAGCEVEATFVSSVVETSGADQSVGRYRAAPFTFTLEP